MNFIISKSYLSNALTIVSHAVSSTSPKPSMRGIRIDAKDDSLVLTGTDSDISIQKTITSNEDNQLTVTEEGSILIESRYLIDIVKKIDSEMVSVEIIDGSLTKFSGNSAVFKINGMNTHDFPTIDFSKPADSISISYKVLKQMISETTFAASVKETRPVLTGVNLKLKDQILTATATDSYRLAKKTIAFPTEASFNVTIPSKSLNEVNGTMLTDEEDRVLEIAFSDKKAQFRNESMILQTRLLDGSYPDTDRLIPHEFAYSLRINRDDFIRAIDRTTFIKNDNMTINRLQLSQNEVVLTNKSQEIGESREILAAQFTGEDLDISFSGNYVMDAAKALRGSELIIEFTGEMKPFILRNEEDETILQLVLPVRTYN